MVDATFGSQPPNSNQSKYQISGLVLSGVAFSTLYSGTTFYSVPVSGQVISGIFIATTPQSESSWNV